MKIAIASDHAGFELKGKIKEFIKKHWASKVRVVDYGPDELVFNDDYPDYVSKVAKEVSEDPLHVKGIVIGASGQGEAMVSNRYKNVRAGVYYGGTLDVLEAVRTHNNSNVLSLGARFLTEKEALKAVEIWLTTPFSEDERHIRRNKKIECLPHSHTQHHD
ncbi:MAG: RpiB/LacA/LacB family sugar-phosphate isomerase [bacterium]|nr:RpiB/LacA/LacB family sugar-phosphate isomerase [bacterium]